MAKQRFYCRRDKAGKLRMLRSDEVIPYRQGESLEDFDTRMRKQLYRMECDEGSRFHIPGMKTRVLQEVWGRL